MKKKGSALYDINLIVQNLLFYFILRGVEAAFLPIVCCLKLSQLC